MNGVDEGHAPPVFAQEASGVMKREPSSAKRAAPAQTISDPALGVETESDVSDADSYTTSREDRERSTRGKLRPYGSQH